MCPGCIFDPSMCVAVPVCDTAVEMENACIFAFDFQCAPSCDATCDFAFTQFLCGPTAMDVDGFVRRCLECINDSGSAANCGCD